MQSTDEDDFIFLEDGDFFGDIFNDSEISDVNSSTFNTYIFIYHSI